MLNWGSRDILDFIMFKITTTAKEAFDKLPHVPIQPQTIQAVKEAVQLATCDKLEFKLKEHEFVAMVAEL